MRKNKFRLFAEDRSRVLRHIDENELNELMNRRRIAWLEDATGKTIGVVFHTQPQQSRTKYVNDTESSSGRLRASDIENNALAQVYKIAVEDLDGNTRLVNPRRPGFDVHEKRNSMIIGNYVDRTMSLVEEWARGDTKATRISPSGIVGLKVVPALP